MCSTPRVNRHAPIANPVLAGVTADTVIYTSGVMLHDCSTRLLVVLAGFSICNALVAEFIGVKIFAMEDTLRFAPFNWVLFGRQGSLNFTAGVLLWPIVFIMTDVINDYFGRRAIENYLDAPRAAELKARAAV